MIANFYLFIRFRSQLFDSPGLTSREDIISLENCFMSDQGLEDFKVKQRNYPLAR